MASFWTPTQILIYSKSSHRLRQSLPPLQIEGNTALLGGNRIWGTPELPTLEKGCWDGSTYFSWPLGPEIWVFIFKSTAHSSDTWFWSKSCGLISTHFICVLRWALWMRSLRRRSGPWHRVTYLSPKDVLCTTNWVAGWSPGMGWNRGSFRSTKLACLRTKSVSRC